MTEKPGKSEVFQRQLLYPSQYPEPSFSKFSHSRAETGVGSEQARRPHQRAVNLLL